MSAHSPMSKTAIRLVLFVTCSAVISHSATVNIHPGQDIPTIVEQNAAGTTFIIYPGTYRLTEPIVPKSGDSFIGQTPCAPPQTSCPVILSGSTVIGPLARFNGTNYEVTNQTQQGKVGSPIGNQILCDPGWEGCIYPEDLFFDGVPYQHLYSSWLPTIGHGQWWFDYNNQIIYFHDNPAGHTVETSVVANAFGGRANNVTIQYLTVKEFASMYPDGTIGTLQGDNALTQGTNWTVQNCEILLNHGAGVRIEYRLHVLNSYIHNNGQIGIGAGIGTTTNPVTQSTNSGVLIQGNVINYNDYAHWDPNFASGGIKVGSTSGVTIRGNTIQHNEGLAVHFDDQSSNALLDGNIITDNFDSDGVDQEAGTGTSIFRNNIVLRNGVQIYNTHYADQLAAHGTSGVSMYCNVLEIPEGNGVPNSWVIGASNRGYSKFPPYEYLTVTGSSFHHNTVIWDAGALGGGGYWQNDVTNQPNFFADNTPPDYNTYHLSSTYPVFIYDNNDSRQNHRKTFAEYQAAGADIHGSADNNYKSGFPSVAITSPADESSFSNSVTVKATATDKSGINRVEFYVDWKLQATVPGPPYNFNWTNGKTGTHIVAAMAYSNAGIHNCYAVTVTKQ